MTQELSKEQKTKRTVIKLSLFVIFMAGFCWALVPMYNVLCKVTGLNGKVSQSQQQTQEIVDNSRTVTVQFLSTMNDNLHNWQFHPKVNQIKVHPGKNYQVEFFAENDTDQDMTVQAIPSITPSLAVKYLKKTQCFCFTQQTLAAHKHRDMPMIFHLDPNIPKEFNTITISYTLFDASGFKPTNNPHAGKLTS